MRDVSNDEIVDYLLGDASEEMVCEIESRATSDAEFRARLELVGGVIGVGRDGGTDAVSAPKPPMPGGARRVLAGVRSRRFLAAVLALLILAGAGWTTWYLAVGPPLMRDNFNDGAFDSRLWHSARPRVREIDGYLRLMNRGSVVTQKEFPGPIEVSFDWKWIDHAEFPLYSDDLCVVLRTSGKHRDKHAFEILDGVVVRFYTYENRLNLESPPLSMIARTAEGGLPMPPDVWHHIRITDDGEKVSVYISGPQIDSRYTREPALQVHCPGEFPNYRIAIYNREPVGGATHESRIDNFAVRRLR